MEASSSNHSYNLAETVKILPLLLECKSKASCFCYYVYTISVQVLWISFAELEAKIKVTTGCSFSLVSAYQKLQKLIFHHWVLLLSLVCLPTCIIYTIADVNTLHHYSLHIRKSVPHLSISLSVLITSQNNVWYVSNDWLCQPTHIITW